MTRDKAIEAANEAWPKINCQAGVELGSGGSASQLSGLNPYSLNAAMSPRVFVELAVALGMLRLDEPNGECGPKLNEWAHLRNALHTLAIDPDYAPLIIKQLHSAGLKIVEK